jgi:hypothetical protein
MKIYCWAFVYLGGGEGILLIPSLGIPNFLCEVSIYCGNLLPSHNPVLGKTCVSLKSQVIRPVCY